MPAQKFPHPAGRIGGCRLVVFQPVTEHGPAGLKVWVIETVVHAGIHNKLDWPPVVAPDGNFVGTVCRRRPIVEGPDKDERGYRRSRRCLLTWRVERPPPGTASCWEGGTV